MPVVVEDRLRGVVSIGDAVSRLHQEREFTLLENDNAQRRIA
jgi:hypothetical protein